MGVEDGVMNYTGNKAYPIQPQLGPARDAGEITKNLQTSLARGGTTEDYNVKLRGLGKRIDEKPKRPYP